ncbi:hypothetical protein L9F63_017721, partial [Diploptera punctata]
MTAGFSAVALPALQSLNHDPVLDDEDASWVAALTAIGAPVGSLLMGPMLEKLGRKWTLIVTNMPAVIGWVFVVTAFQPIFIPLLYLGRLLTGLAAGLVSPPAVVYCGEVVDKGMRGVVVTFPSIGVISWNGVCLHAGCNIERKLAHGGGNIFSSSIPIISMIVVWFMVPESPVWLASRGRTEAAEASMRAVRNLGPEDKLPEEVQEELDCMIETKNNKDNTHKDTWKDTLRFLKRPEAYKPLIIMNAFFFFQQFTGILVVMMYTVNIVQDIGLDFDGYLATVIIGATRFVMSVAISYASKTQGRRVLCTLSGVGMTLSMTTLAAFLSLTRDGVIGRGELSWIPVIALVIFILSSTVGFYNLPFAMLGEVFPTRIKGSAVGFSMFMASLYFFVAVKIFPALKDTFEYNNVFTFYAVMCLAGTLTMYKFLPETHGKTLQEVEDS